MKIEKFFGNRNLSVEQAVDLVYRRAKEKKNKMFSFGYY
jgi:hypothetical protein